MTDEELATEADRILIRYARNERVIECIEGRLTEIVGALMKFAHVGPTDRGGEEHEAWLEARKGYDLEGKIAALHAARAQRLDLVKQMEANGLTHMLRRRGS